jgi:histidine triad (HIT) family protein
MPADCLFCRIIAGDVPATVVREDADTLAFTDINPQAPTHVLVVPKTHLANVAELAGEPTVAAAVLGGIRAVAEQLGLDSFRTVFNTGAEAGQSVFHVHAHVLAGRPMTGALG